MKRQDAIKQLLRAGKGEDVRRMIDDTVNKHGARYNAIEGDSTLSEDGKRYRLAAAYVSATAELDRQLSEMASRAVVDDRDDAERVFGIRGLPGDHASLVISRRDAADRVARVEDREELRALLTQATRTGDEVLARAVAERAVQQGDATTMYQFVADRPDLDAAAERLWNAEQASSNAFSVITNLASLRPLGLNGMAEYEINELAKQGEPTETTEPAFSNSAPGAYFAGGPGDAW